MRFVVSMVEIIGNLSAPAQDLGTLDAGHPGYLLIWDISVALMRSLPCFNRTVSCLSAVAASAVSRAVGRPALRM